MISDCQNETLSKRWRRHEWGPLSLAYNWHAFSHLCTAKTKISFRGNVKKKETGTVRFCFVGTVEGREPTSNKKMSNVDRFVSCFVILLMFYLAMQRLNHVRAPLLYIRDPCSWRIWKRKRKGKINFCLGKNKHVRCSIHICLVG